MAKGKGSKESHYHDKGGHDASRGRYAPPHGIFEHFTTWSNDKAAQNAQENKSYDKGWRNTTDQKKS